ncbi:MAG: ATP-binding protein [Elusimicrobiota bacterium]|nr:MAG: ATP-binding protein [Elusimicrobiota bacterium]
MSGKTYKVLLIEGDTDETSLVRRTLGGADGSPDRFEVVEAVRVSSACHLLDREDFDAAILDLGVPQGGGLEGLARVRAQRPDLPILLLTSLHDEPLAEQALKRGAQDYLVKGTMDCFLLKRAIRHAVEKKKLTALVERLLDQDPAARVVVDADAHVLHANPAAEALFGAAARDLVGKPFAYPRDSGSVTIVSPRADESPAEMTVSGVDWNGEPARLVTFRASAAARPAAADDAETKRLEGIKALFTRRFNHEMRNIISTVKTAVFCLKDAPSGPLSVRQARLVDMITRNVDRQARLFDKLGDLSRFEGGRLKASREPFDLGALLGELARENGSGAGGVEVDVASSAGLPQLEGDADLVLQMLRALVDNARRHARSRVTVEASEENGGVRVGVLDDGPGVAADKIAGLFTSFSGLDRREAAGGGFNGSLGLTMCREIAEAHGGRVWADAGEGGRFFVFLPARPPAPKPAAPRIYVSSSRSRPTYAAEAP